MEGAMVQVGAVEILDGPRTTDVKSFTALVGENLLMFEPTGAFGRDMADEDDELIWDVKRRSDDHAWQDVTRVRIARDASRSEILDECQSVMHWDGLGSPMRLLRHVATLAFGCEEWEAMAAQRLGVTLFELEGWTAGKPPPEDLLNRLEAFVPQLRNAAFRLRTRAEHAYMLLEFLAPSSPREENKRRRERSGRRSSKHRGKARE